MARVFLLYGIRGRWVARGLAVDFAYCAAKGDFDCVNFIVVFFKSKELGEGGLLTGSRWILRAAPQKGILIT